MNINFNQIIKKSIPLASILLIAYIIDTLAYIYLPKVGVDFKEESMQSLKYRKYDGFYNENKKVEEKVNIIKAVDEKTTTNLSNYSLNAIYSTTSNAGWIIVKNTLKDKTYILSQYEKMDDYVLTKLFKNFVILEKEGEEFRLDIVKDREKASFEITKNDNGVKENIIVDSNGVKVNREYLNEYIENVEKVWKNIAINEVRNNGKIEGFQVLNINEKSVFSKLGLKKGDVIKSVNNNELNSYSDAFKIYNDINNIKYLNMQILRNNEIMELNYEIN